MEKIKPGWHTADICAAVKKHGKSLTGLAHERGIHEAACRRAAVARNTPGERAIAELIGVPLWELWPDRWFPPSTPGAEPVRIDHRRHRKPADNPR